MATIHKTRFKELGYWMVEAGCWSVVDLSDPDRPAQVGQKYPTKATLLANLENYAAEYGCELAKPRVAIASADLIAAAPDMADVLKEVRQKLNLDMSKMYVYHNKKVACSDCGRFFPLNRNTDGTATILVDHNPDCECGRTHALMGRIDAVLAKAEGE